MDLATFLKDQSKTSFEQTFGPILNNCSKSFACIIISFNPHDNFIMTVTILQMKKLKLKRD